MRGILFATAMPCLDEWKAVQLERQFAALEALLSQMLNATLRCGQHEIASPDKVGCGRPMWKLKCDAALVTKTSKRVVDLTVVLQCNTNPHMRTGEIVIERKRAASARFIEQASKRLLKEQCTFEVGVPSLLEDGIYSNRQINLPLYDTMERSTNGADFRSRDARVGRRIAAP